MFRKRLIRRILGGTLSIAMLTSMSAPAITPRSTAFASPRVDITSTEQIISADSFGSRAGLPVTESKYTHSPQFKGYKIQKGIDVSQWNGQINWKKVKASGVTFAFIRVGGRYYGSGKLYVDEMYRQNIKAATAAGIDVGVYFYSQATTVAEARAEANYTMNLLSGFNINLPVVMDYEYAWEGGLTGRLYKAHLSKSAATSVINTFCSTVEAKGYTGMLYASKTVITDDMNVKNICDKYPIWSALYSDTNTDTLTAPHSYWQYTDSGTVPGIGRATDLNFRYIKAPVAPKSAALLSSTDSSITLKWDKVPEVYGYQIVRLDEKTNKYVPVGTVKGAGTVTFTDKGLQDGKKYTYKVRGLYKLNSGTVYGAFSNACAGVTITDNIENFKVAGTSDSAVKLSWTPITEATGYRIYRLNPNTNKYEMLTTITNSATSTYTDTDLNGGIDYTYKIRAYTTIESGTTIWHVVSDAITGTTDPGLVSGLKVKLSTSDSISIQWTKEKNVDGYLVYTWDKATATWTRIGNVKGGDQTTFTHTGLKPSTQYSYAVRTYYTKSGKSRFTDFSSALDVFSGPAAPSKIVTKSRSENSIGFAWSRVPSATGYIIYSYDRNSKKYVQVAKTTDNRDCSYTIDNLEPTTSYAFAVRSYIKKDGVSGGSSYTVLKTVTTPAAPSTIKYMPLGSYRCTKWTKVNGVDGYIVYLYDRKAKKFTAVKKLTGADSTTYIGKAVDARYYTYVVRAYMTYNKNTYYGTVSKAPASATLSVVGVINDPAVRVRRGPSTNNSIITEITKGKKVAVIGSVKRNGETWFKVSFTKKGKKVTGYMYSRYIDIKQ